MYYTFYDDSDYPNFFEINLPDDFFKKCYTILKNEQKFIRKDLESLLKSVNGSTNRDESHLFVAFNEETRFFDFDIGNDTEDYLIKFKKYNPSANLYLDGRLATSLKQLDAPETEIYFFNYTAQFSLSLEKVNGEEILSLVVYKYHDDYDYDTEYFSSHIIPKNLYLHSNITNKF